MIDRSVANSERRYAMFIIEQIVAWAIGVMMATAVNVFVQATIKERKFRGWCVKITKGSDLLCTRAVGTKKAEEVLDDASTLSVFVKGIASPFVWLNEDLVSDNARKSGLFWVDWNNKTWHVDILKNPPPPEKKTEKPRG